MVLKVTPSLLRTASAAAVVLVLVLVLLLFRVGLLSMLELSFSSFPLLHQTFASASDNLRAGAGGMHSPAPVTELLCSLGVHAGRHMTGKNMTCLCPIP